jgi:hypothetical protein
LPTGAPPLARLPRGRKELARFLDRSTLDGAVAAGRPMDIDWGLGASILVRRTAWDQVGPMDVAYFLYFEDVDWCLRCWQAGWKVQYLPTATCRHAHGRASASGGLLGLVTNPLTRTHLTSAIRFFRKFGLRPTRETGRTTPLETGRTTPLETGRTAAGANRQDAAGSPSGIGGGRS